MEKSSELFEKEPMFLLRTNL